MVGGARWSCVGNTSQLKKGGHRGPPFFEGRHIRLLRTENRCSANVGMKPRTEHPGPGLCFLLRLGWVLSTDTQATSDQRSHSLSEVEKPQDPEAQSSTFWRHFHPLLYYISYNGLKFSLISVQTGGPCRPGWAPL